MATRLVMSGAFVGALLVLGTSMVFSWPPGLSAGPGKAGAEQEEAKAEALAAAFEAPTGSCLVWFNPDASDIRTLSCDEAHLFEVTGTVDIGVDYPPEAPSPPIEAWQQIAQQKCTEGAIGYLNGKFDPFGKFSVGALKPSTDQWNSGDRKLRCGLQRSAQSGKLVTTTGPARQVDQSDVFEPGTCLALENQSIGDPIDCTRGHAYEVVGLVNLGVDFPKDYPSEDTQKNKLSEQCARAAGEYSGGLDLASRNLILTWDTRKKESWDNGSRTVSCKVGALRPDRPELAPVTGSIRAVAAPAEGSQPPPPPGG